MEKPFIELSILELKKAGSDITQYKYFKLLIQEFAVKIDQGLIVAILAFLRAENVCDSLSLDFLSSLLFLKNDAAPAVNMSTDIEQLQKSYDVIVKAQIDTPSGEAQMFFDEIHLSPLKVRWTEGKLGLHRVLPCSDPCQFLDAWFEAHRGTPG